MALFSYESSGTWKSRIVSSLLLLCGYGSIGFIVIRPPDEKSAIFASALGLLSILLGTHLMIKDKPYSLPLHKSWIRYLPLFIGVFVDLTAGLIPPATGAVALAAALLLLFCLCSRADESGVYLIVLTIFLAASIAYNVYAFYPIILGVDPWTNISVAAAILQTGHFSSAIVSQSASGLSLYYATFPVMAMASAMLSSATGLDVRIAILIFPGCLVLLQPLIVFVLARAVYGGSLAAMFSGFIALIESSVTQWIPAPLAESVAISMILILLAMLLVRRRSASNLVTELILFSTASVLHGAIALISMIIIPLLVGLRRSRFLTIIATFSVIFLAYVTSTLLIVTLAEPLALVENRMLGFLFGSEASGRGIGLVTGALYAAGSPGIIFVWWGLPVALTLFSILVLGRKGTSSWAYVGLATLGFSFILNIIAPTLVADRYGGLIGWLLLAVAGGKPLAALTTNHRRLLLVAPIIFLVCFSSVANPLLSPQYGYFAHNNQWSPGYNGIPLTDTDTAALNWMQPHMSINVISDIYSAAYLTFLRFQSGIYSQNGILLSLYYPLTTPMPPPRQAVFIRWWYLRPTAGGACYGLTSTLTGQQTSHVVNIVYGNSCDTVETNPA